MEVIMRKAWWKSVGAAVVSLSMIVTAGPVTGPGAAGLAKKAEAANVAKVKECSVVVDGNDIRTENKNGLTFKGFGMLSGNSTSDLLLDYKAEQPEAYAQLMQYLFGGKYPIMTHVKLEMGNDKNTSTGPETATKRSKDEKANVSRNPGWQIAADAKKINPDVKVSILSWCTPKWVKTDEDMYTWYKESILDGYDRYGYMINYINPNKNEAWNKTSDINRTKLFAKWIKAEDKTTIPDDTERALYQKIKLVVSDESGTVSDSVGENLKSDPDFYNAVDVVGYHYSPWDDSNGSMKWFADEQDKEVWNSEAQATFSNSAFRPSNNMKNPTVEGTGIGGSGSALEMGNTFIKGFVESRRTHVIYQPAIGSFYEGGQYSYKELVSARDPWSGWMHYDAGLLVLAHVSKFAKTGWENEDNTAGIWRAIPEASKSTADGTNPVIGNNGDADYMTLAAPSKDQFSTLIVNDSEYAQKYTIKVQNMKLKENQTLGIWETRAADEGAFNENYMKYRGESTADAQGTYTIEVKPYSVVTVTTLDVSVDEEHTKALPVEGERTVLDTDETGAVQDTSGEYLYADDFEYTGKTVKVLDGKGGFTDETEDYIASRGGDTGAMARYTHTMNGAFEVYKTSDGSHVLRQQLDKDTYGVGSAWGSGDPVTAIGDFRWMNYSASVDVSFEKEGDDQYAAIAVRQTGTHQKVKSSAGYVFTLQANGVWDLSAKGSTVAEGYITADNGFHAGAGVWNNIKLKAAGNKITAYLNGCQVAAYTDDTPVTSGRIALASAHSFTQFDNLKVKKVNGYAPYYTELLDDQQTYDLTEQKNPKLVYNGSWSHSNGQGMYVYQRSISRNNEKGASLTYTFKGTGLEVIGGSKAGDATIRATVDGTIWGDDVKTQKAKDTNTNYSLTGLPDAEHTVTLEVVDGTWSVDAVGVVGSLAETAADPDDANEPIRSEEVPVPTVKPSAAPTETPQKTPEPSTPAAPATTAAVAADTAAPVQTVKSGKAVYTIKDSKSVEYAPSNGKLTKAVIPATIKLTVDGKKQTYKVTGIRAGAFKGNKKLSNVTIGKNVTTIGKDAFSGCSSLKKITIQSTRLKTVGKNAIKGTNKKLVIKCGKKKAAYKKLFTAKTGYKKNMKIK